ncbi:hypothetical protein MNBD_GAMMA03-601 [hydrothermal vent metagenome]|uniref:Glycosyltransferase RgtA/B/C/D-like domain-containing protein n=1 Tax=hydrothermal vent metagenome TaxID=652676 RepID=A0A3B0W5B7_9ZZZZ
MNLNSNLNLNQTPPHSLSFWIALSAFWCELSQHERWAIIAFLVLKWVLLLHVPLTGDEAYFIVWGQSLSLGYYDHPPMVGWVLWVLNGFGTGVLDYLVVYRLFAYLAAIVIAYVLYQALQLHPSIPSKTAFYVALAFLVSPISLMFVVTANDTVLVFFAVLGFYFYAKALAQPSVFHAILAGVFLGLAFLSKYFAAFMLLGLFLYSLVFIRQIVWKHFLLMTAVVLLFVAENMYFNATHCWNNILFNFFSRTTDSSFDIGNVLSYVLMILALLSPLGVFYWVKSFCGASQKTQNNTYKNISPPLFKQVLFATLPLLAILLLVSFTNSVGLHWPLLSVTLLYLLYARLSLVQLRKVLLFNVYSSFVLGALLLLALAFVSQLIPDSQKHHVAVYTQPEKVCAQLPESTFFTLGYSSQSVLSYHCQNDDIHVFMSTSKYGREDDKKTNFKAMDGQDLTLFVTHKKEIKKLEPFFKHLIVEPFEIEEGVTYYLVQGVGFDYKTYHQKILTVVNEQFYTPPEWFPKIAEWLGVEGCGFKTQYGF